MKCQICGKDSGYFPICKEHQRMAQDGEVARCEICGSYYVISSGCQNCDSKASVRREMPPESTKPSSKDSTFSTEKKDKEPSSGTAQSKQHDAKEITISEDSRFGRIISIELLMDVMQKEPPPDRHNTLQFDLAASLLLSSDNCDVRVDIKPVRKGPRAHIWYFDENYNAPIMLRMIRSSDKDDNKDRAWRNYLKDCTELETIVEEGECDEAYCLLFTDDDEYKRKILDEDIHGSLVDLSGRSPRSRYFCYIRHIHDSDDGQIATMESSSTNIESGESVQKCIDCGKVIPTNPAKPRCYQCWRTKFRR